MERKRSNSLLPRSVFSFVFVQAKGIDQLHIVSRISGRIRWTEWNMSSYRYWTCRRRRSVRPWRTRYQTWNWPNPLVLRAVGGSVNEFRMQAATNWIFSRLKHAPFVVRPTWSLSDSFRSGPCSESCWASAWRWSACLVNEVSRFSVHPANHNKIKEKNATEEWRALRNN